MHYLFRKWFHIELLHPSIHPSIQKSKTKKNEKQYPGSVWSSYPQESTVPANTTASPFKHLRSVFIALAPPFLHFC